MKYARIKDDVALEIFTPPEDFTLDECFRADVAALFEEVPDDVVVHSWRVDGNWMAPLVEEVETRPPPAPEPLTPMAFYLAFTAQERIKIKTSADLIVKEFWETYQLAAQTNSLIHPALVSVSGAIQYLRQIGILETDQRVDQVLHGIPQ